MSKITDEQIPLLIEAGCLTDLNLTKADKSGFVDPKSIADGSWINRRKTRVHAKLCGFEIEASFDPTRVGSMDNVLSKIVATQAGRTPLEPRPTEIELLHEALAFSITEALPHISNHAKLRIYEVLGVAPE